MFNSSCSRCPLHVTATNVCIPASGPDDAEILFMGEAPGGEEDADNQVFIGSAGQELDSLLKRAKLPRKKVRISNCVRCRPPANRNPTDDERGACMFYTVQELQTVRPKIIVALGVSALKALTGVGKIGDSRGKMLPLLPEYRSDVQVLATYHPAAYLHQPNMREAYSKAIKDDMKLANKIATGTVLQKEIITALSGKKKVRVALRRLAKYKELACDLEWEVIPARKGPTIKKEPVGPWPWSKRRGRLPRPISIAIAGRDGDKLLAVSIPLVKNSFTPDYRKAVRKIVASIPTIYHNGLSDLPWLYSMGWEVILAGDTFIHSSLLDIDGPRGLKPLSARLTDMDVGYEREVDLGVMPTTKREWRRTMQYNGSDSIATVLLKPALLKLMRKQKRTDAMPLYEHVLLPAVCVLARTALNGIPIDEKLLAKKRRLLLRRRKRAVERVGSVLGLPVNAYESIIGKNQQLAPYVERVLGIKLPHTPKQDNPSLTNDLLLQHKKAHPIIPVMIQERKMAKRESSYYRPWTWLLDTQQDNRLHTTSRLTHARSGRSSAESEAGNTFQQFPRKKSVRRIVRAQKGKLILAADQSQIELRFIAWRSRDPRMLQFFREDKDLHAAMAGLVKVLNQGWTLRRYLKHMDRLMGEVTEEERYGAKPINFGLGFGGGPPVIIKTARKDYGIVYTQDQAELAYDAYHQFYERVKSWQETFWRDVERGYGRNVTGRRRTVYEDAEGPEGVWRKYINFDIQGPASDLALLCQNYTWELLAKEYGRHLHSIVENIGFFHDAMLLHLDKSERKAIKAIVEESWEHPPLDRLGLEIDVPLKVDIKIDTVWT